jgi:alkylation response protein AidB-like acyl-CoA dehydrogenase
VRTRGCGRRGQRGQLDELPRHRIGAEEADTATPLGDGRFAIKGTKIYISFGDHNMADNIVHLVLARTPDAPAGTRGISLFLVPKYRLNADGTPGDFNDVRVVSIEHKMGLHASPTRVLSLATGIEITKNVLGAAGDSTVHPTIKAVPSAPANT